MARIFIDTNHFMHFKRPDQIDWCKLVEAAEVTIVIAPVVVRELDKRKLDQRTKFRERAAAIVKWIHDTYKTGSRVRAGVRLDVIAREPSISFEQHELDRDIADDRLLAHLIEESQAAAPLLVSADMGILLKAHARGLRTIQPPGEWALPFPDDSNEAEIKRLRARVEQLQDTRPELQLVSRNNKSDTILVRLYPTLTDVPGAASRAASLLRSKFTSRALHNDQDEEQYRQKLDAEWGTFAEQYALYQRRVRRKFWLPLVVRNSGRAPAEDLDIWIQMPSGVVSGDDLEAPPPPVDSRLGVLGDMLNHHERQQQRPLDPFYRAARWHWDKHYNGAHTSIDDVKHRYVRELAALPLIFDSEEDIRTFELHYEITVSRPAATFEGVVTVLLEERTEEQRQTDPPEFESDDD